MKSALKNSFFIRPGAPEFDVERMDLVGSRLEKSSGEYRVRLPLARVTVHLSKVDEFSTAAEVAPPDDVTDLAGLLEALDGALARR